MNIRRLRHNELSRKPTIYPTGNLHNTTTAFEDNFYDRINRRVLQAPAPAKPRFPKT